MKKAVWRKQSIILVGSIVLFFLYMFFLPEVHLKFGKELELLFAMMLYITVIICALLKIDRSRIEKRDFVVACACGLLSMAYFLPRDQNTLNFHIPGITPARVIIVNLVIGITVTLAYLLSVSRASAYGVRKTVMRPITAGNVKTYLGILLVVCVVFWVSKGFKAPAEFKAPIGISLLQILSFIGVGISEEVIFRFLPYAYSISLGEGNNHSRILTFLLMTLFFTLLHFITPIYNNGFFATLPTILQWLLVSTTPITLLYLKRDLFTAISAHALIDILSMFY